MKTAFRRYNRLLLGLLAVVILAICGVAIYMEPLTGDLTRLGGYLENDFGWQGEQDCFSPPLFVFATSLAEYDQYYDIVLLGDSFSKPTEIGGWQNYLIASTGLSMITFSTDHVNFPELFGSEGFQRHPPRIFIYQLVERNLWFDHRTFEPREDPASTPREDLAALPCTPLAAAPLSRPRFEPSQRWTSVNLDAASNYLYKAFLRDFFDLNLTKTICCDLSRVKLFTSRSHQQLLIYDDDLLKRDLREPQIARIAESIAARARRAEANGRTRFLTLIAPDKSSAYADFIEAGYRNLSIIPVLAEMPGMNFVRLDTPLRAAIRNGERDVYLPNDTHWGSLGCRIVAREVRIHLMLQGILQPAQTLTR